jgi:hypothetical protein
VDFSVEKKTGVLKHFKITTILENIFSRLNKTNCFNQNLLSRSI